MRRYEIDWIRNISILMLFVYHTCAIFCIFGDFYIVSQEKNLFANLFIILLFVWYMPMLFFLAGASTYFSSKKRSFKQYLLERIKKLLIPFLFGTIFLVPPQTYLARLWRGESDLNYFEHLKYFFTTLTDFSGFDGAFTPAHLWFILYLFIVSIIAGIIIFELFNSKKGMNIVNMLINVLFSKSSFIILLLIGVISDIFPSIMGKSIVACLIIFIMGYIVYSNDDILDKIILNRFKLLWILILTLTLGMMYVFLLRENISDKLIWFIDSILKNIVLICAIGSVTAFSSLHLNKNNLVLRYLNKSAFPVYIVHQPVLLGLAFFIIPLVKSTTLAMVLIIVISLIITFLLVEYMKRLKVFNVALGLK